MAGVKKASDKSLYLYFIYRKTLNSTPFSFKHSDFSAYNNNDF